MHTASVDRFGLLCIFHFLLGSGLDDAIRVCQFSISHQRSRGHAMEVHRISCLCLSQLIGFYKDPSTFSTFGPLLYPTQLSWLFVTMAI